jgi:hypothetical protein
MPRAGSLNYSFVWVAHFRRLVRDYERLPATVASIQWIFYIESLTGSNGGETDLSGLSLPIQLEVHSFIAKYYVKERATVEYAGTLIIAV